MHLQIGKGVLVWQAGAPELQVDEVDEETLERPHIDHVWTIKVPQSPILSQAQPGSCVDPVCLA